MEPDQNHREEEILVHDDEVQQLMQSLPKATGDDARLQLIKYQNCWHFCEPSSLKNVLAFQRHFRARDTDLIIASHPKTGTTWLKSLLFATVNRVQNPTNQSPLLAHHPHELVYRLENEIYSDNTFTYPRPYHLNKLPSPRLFSTHLPFTSLPESITTSKCRILYIGRNPLDTCVSQWHFYMNVLRKAMKEDFEPRPIEDYFEDFYQGKILYGPFFDHMLEYWKQSLEQRDKVLFLKYEDLKDDTSLHLKKLAEFIGLPFSCEEERQGVVEELIKLCNINNLKEVDANKKGVLNKLYEKNAYFRKGVVGDWINYFPPTIVNKMNMLMEEKFGGTGLSFKLL